MKTEHLRSYIHMNTGKLRKNKLRAAAFESDLFRDPHDPASTSKSDSAKKNKTKGKMIEFLSIATIPLVLVLGNSMLIPILPDMAKALNVTQFQTSLIITLFSVTAGLFIPVLGYLSDRYSRKAIIIPALIVYGAGGILAGFGAVWKSYGIIFAARIIQGLGAAGTVSLALVGDLYDGATESKALGITEAANGFGKVISPILGSLFALIIWYAAFFAFPVFCAASILMLVFFIKEPKRQDKPVKLKQYVKNIGRIFKEKGRWLIASFVAGSVSLFILFGVLFYLSDILEQKPYEIDGIVKGLILAIPLTGLVITSYITGSVIKKNGVLIRRVMIAGFILATASLTFAIFFHKQIYVLISMLTLSSIGTGLVLPCLNTMITGAVERKQRGVVTSLYSSLRFFGVAFGPPLFSWLMAGSDRTLFIAVSSLSLIMLVLVALFIKPDKQIE